MVNIPLGLGDWKSETQNIARIKLRNTYVVDNPSAPEGVSRVSRPTLTTLYTVGTGPITAIWQQPNILAGDFLVVSGTQLYRVNGANVATLIGSLPGAGKVEIAGTQLLGLPDIVLIVRNGVLYQTNGVTISTITVPDSQLVESVATINSYFLFSVQNTQKFYWLEPGSLVVDPLHFASAERIPDPIKAISVVSDEIWFLGLTGPEVWVPTGDANDPFERVPGRVYREGCFSKETVVSTAVNGIPALIWVTDTKAVVKAQGTPEKISNESVEELLKTTDNLSAWFFRYNRHDFYIINSERFSLVYDMTAGLWCSWDSYLLAYWRPQTGAQKGTIVVAGDSLSNKVFRLDEGVSDDGDVVVREISGYLRADARGVRANEVIAYVNAGWSPDYTTNPQLELRWSDDLGNTWSDYMSASLGATGQYNTTVSFRSLGKIKSPGRVFEFRVTDMIRFRLDYATLNEKNDGI